MDIKKHITVIFLLAVGLFSFGLVAEEKEAEASTIFQDKSEFTNVGTMFVPIKKQDKRYLQTGISARKTLSQFRSLLNKTKEKQSAAMIKVWLKNPKTNDKVEMWLRILDDKNNSFHAEVFDEHPKLKNYRRGHKLHVPNSKISDWVFVKDGQFHGAYSYRLHRANLTTVEKKQFDLYIGAKSYAPLPK